VVLVGKCAAGMATMASKSRTRDAAEVLSRDEGYLAELLSFSLDRLNKEPELLKDDQVRIQRQLEETAFKNYKAFVATAECVEKVGQGLSDIGKELSSIHDRVPAIERDASAYENTLESHLREQTQNKLVVANASQVQEILEVKQLMETCIRHGSYDEALDLEAFVNKLTVLHPNVSIVRSLEKQSKDLSKRMQKQLFGRLRGNLQLPECLPSWATSQVGRLHRERPEGGVLGLPGRLISVPRGRPPSQRPLHFHQARHGLPPRPPLGHHHAVPCHLQQGGVPVEGRQVRVRGPSPRVVGQEN